MKRIDKPWGYEILFAFTKKYAGKILFIKKGNRLSYQYHKKKEETFYLFSGSLEILLNDGTGEKTINLSAGDNLHLQPGVKHRPYAKEDSFVFEVSTPELDDVVRIEDDYGRI